MDDVVEGTVFGFPLKIYSVLLPRQVVDFIVKIIADKFPIEACGILMGEIKGETARVTYVDELRNILASSKAFWFSELEWMEKIIQGRKRGYQYIGLFHSHNRENPLPSLNDRHRMMECPGEVWLIIAYKPGLEPKLAAWRIDDWGNSILKLKIFYI